MVKFTAKEREKNVFEYENSNKGAKYFCEKYGFCKPNTLYKWVKKYKLFGIAEKHEFVLNMTIIDGYVSWQNAIVETFFNSIKQVWNNNYLDAGDLIQKMNLGIWNYTNIQIHMQIKTTLELLFQCGTI